MITARIRTTTFSDWKIIQRLNAEVFENSKQWDPFINLNDPYSTQSIKEYQEEVNDPNMFCRIAEVGSEAAGYLVGRESNYAYRINKRGEIYHMGVSPKYRDLGIGSQLITEFKKWCIKRGITHIAANTYFEDKKVRHFYEKNGLKAIDITLEGLIDKKGI
jgi:ribosomal protein S18 acetylase RimI-like enzyme